MSVFQRESLELSCEQLSYFYIQCMQPDSKAYWRTTVRKSKQELTVRRMIVKIMTTVVVLRLFSNVILGELRDSYFLGKMQKRCIQL